MSFDALAWAGKCRPGSASRKLVLFALADRHNDEVNGAYPSVAWIAEFTDLNRKTVINCLAELEAAGFISDSGDRRGDTRQIKLYRLHLETVPQTEQFQKRNSSKKGAKQSQKRDTDTVRTTPPKKDKPSSVVRAKVELPDDWKPKDFGADSESRKVVDGWPPGELAHQLEHFRAHHRKKGDRFKSWQDAWSTWVLNSRSFGVQNGRQPISGQPLSLRGTRPDPSLDFVRQADADLAAERRSAADHRGDRPSLPSFGPS